MNGRSVLLVEDNRSVQEFNKDLLEKKGHAVALAMTLADARNCLSRQEPDIMVLDIDMPDGNGLDFLRELRKTSALPVLILTGHDKSADEVKGFDNGCDDYMTKPYTFEVLNARIDRLLYRAGKLPETIARGPLTLNILAKEAFINGIDLMLTPKDFALLQYFVQHEDQAMDAGVIYEQVWGRPMLESDSAVKSAVSRLRNKLKDSGLTIENKRGNGYRLVLE